MRVLWKAVNEKNEDFRDWVTRPCFGCVERVKGGGV